MQRWFGVAAYDDRQRLAQMTSRFISPDLHLWKNSAARSRMVIMFIEDPSSLDSTAYEGRVEAESDAYFWTFSTR